MAKEEVTGGSVLLGLGAGMLACAANLYMGLRAGITLAASVPTAALGVALLRRTLPANIAQTTASAGESLATGLFFCMPALIIADLWQSFDFTITTALGIVGGLLGVLLMIPMREALMGSTQVKYVRGKMCADVLQSKERVVKPLVAGAVVGGLSKGFAALSEGATTVLAKGIVGVDLAVAPFAAGALFGPVVAAGIIFGTALCALVLVPIHAGGSGVDAVTAWHTVRYAGVGAMAAVAVFWLLEVWRDLARAMAATRRYLTIRKNPSDISRAALFVSITLVSATLLFYMNTFTGGIRCGITGWLFVLAAAFLVVVISSRLAGLGHPAAMLGVATFSVNPVTGVVLLIVSLFATVGASLFGGGLQAQEIVLLGGVVLTCAAATAADIAQDLKTGQIVGAKPYSQQLMQVLGVLFAAPLVAPVLTWLNEGYSIGSDALPAPQATMFATITGALLGRKTPLSLGLFLLGAGIGVSLVALEMLLRRRRKGFRVPSMAVAVGLFLPPPLGVVVAAGGFSVWLARRVGKGGARLAFVVCAAGLIGGEALVGVLCGPLRSMGLCIPLRHGLLPAALFLLLAFLLLTRFQRKRKATFSS